MANYANLLATIAANIYTNGNQEVTAAMVKSAVDAMVGSLGYGYQFRGAASPSDNPGTPDQRVYFVAKSAGIYTNFGNISVSEDEIAILKWDSAWSKEVLTINAISNIAPRLAQQDAEIASFEQTIRELVENYPNVTIYGNVTNNPDNEDINTNENNQLQFADRSTLYGMGYKILRRDKTFAEQVTEANTIYEIRYDFDLNGESVTIPSGCILTFNGGQLYNGTLVGQDTCINAEKVAIFNSINIDGTWNVTNIYSEWFTDIATNKINLLFMLSNADIHNNIHISSGTYIVEIDEEDGAAISVKSNTNVYLDGDIYLAQTSLESYKIFSINGATNVNVSGCGKIVGDKDEHNGTTGEWGFGVSIVDSFDIFVNGLTIKDCWGDSVYVRENTTGAVKNIVVSDCILTGSRRQGVSVIGGSFIKILRCKIANINGTLPKGGIDLEPNPGGSPISFVWIEGCHISSCKYGVIVDSNHNTVENTYICDNVLENNSDGNVYTLHNTQKVFVLRNYIKGIIKLESTSKYIRIENNIIEDAYLILQGYYNAFNGNVVTIAQKSDLSFRYSTFEQNVISCNDSVVNNSLIEVGSANNTIVAYNKCIKYIAGYYIFFAASGCKAAFIGNTLVEGENTRLVHPDNGTFMQSVDYRNHGSQRPTIRAYGTYYDNQVIGFRFFNTSSNMSEFWTNQKWVDAMGMTPGIHSGTFAQKPTLIPSDAGYSYLCKSGASIDGGTTEKINLMMFYTGSDWVDANGTSVVAYD